MEVPKGLAEISRSKFIDLAWGNQLKEVLKKENLNTRNLYEISSATTQCTNVIGPCNDNSCTCWICGTPIFLTDQGNQWSAQQLDVYNKSGAKGNRTKVLQLARAKNPNIMHILPQCEHILPVMQAFLILGGLYWTETIADEGLQFQEKMKEEYAWSHAYCNNLKDEFNFFDDAGNVRTEMIIQMLIKIYQNVAPIRNYLIKNMRVKNNLKSIEFWANKQLESLTKDKLDPLIKRYKKIIRNPLDFLSSVATPIQHVENSLRRHFGPDSPRIKALEDFKPEIITPLSIPDWRLKQSQALSRGKISGEFITDIQEKLRMNFLKDLIIELYNSAGNRKQRDIVNQFILSLLNKREYLERLSRSNFNENINTWYDNFFKKELMPLVDLNAIITLANSPLVEKGREHYTITLVQTLALLNLLSMIDPSLKKTDQFSNLRKAVSSDTTDLLKPFLNTIKEYFATAVVLLLDNKDFAVNLPLTQYILGSLSSERTREMGTHNPFAYYWKTFFPKNTGIYNRLNVNTFIDEPVTESITQERMRQNIQMYKKILGFAAQPPTDATPPTDTTPPTEGMPMERTIAVSPIKSSQPEYDDPTSTEDTEVTAAATRLVSLQKDGVGGGGRKKTSKNKRHHKTRRYKKKHRRRQTMKKKRIKKRRTVKK